MFRVFSLSLIGILLLFSCKESSSKRADLIEKQNGTDPIMIDRLYGETENYLSFPVWFDAELISKDGITRIDRSIFLVDLDDTLENGRPVQSIRERRQYWFFASGRLKKMRVTHYYDDQDVGHITFGYYDTIDRFGFSAAYKMDATGFLPDADLPADFPFRLDRFVQRTPRVTCYLDEVTKSQLFQFNSPEFWGIVSIDSIANPKRKDWVVLGSILKPNKLFQLHDKVLIENEIVWDYNPNKSTKRIKIDNYPFHVHRTLSYSKNGNFSHFIDSTFSDEGFLSRSNYKLFRDDAGRIEKVIKRKENQGHQSTAIRVDFFHYETMKTSTTDPNKMRNFTKNQKK